MLACAGRVVRSAPAAAAATESGGDAKIRLLNLSTGYTSLDLITNLDADDDDEDETQATASRSKR